MLQTILLKNSIPFLLGMFISAAAILGIIHYTQKKIEVNCPAPQITVNEVKCEEKQNAFEIDKMKGFKGTIEVVQNYTVEMGVDSALIKKIVRDMMRDEGKIKLKDKRTKGK